LEKKKCYQVNFVGGGFGGSKEHFLGLLQRTLGWIEDVNRSNAET
jgi:hypothetical protein